MTEEEYKLFIKDFVSRFVEENLDNYVYSCTTECEARGGTCEGFVQRTEETPVECYRFEYKMVKGGTETSDRIYFSVSYEMAEVSIALSQHEFDNVTVPNINESRLNATISAGMQTHVDDCLEEGYVYDGSWTLDNAKWRMINGVPTYVCNIGVSYGMTDGEEGYAEVVTFEIQPTVENGEATE